VTPTTLLDHVSPAGDIHSLYLDPSGSTGGGGWSTRLIYGNCLFWNLTYFANPLVEEYLRLVHATGGLYRYRWTDQPVHTMLAEIFVPKERWHQFSFDFRHKHPEGEQ